MLRNRSNKLDHIGGRIEPETMPSGMIWIWVGGNGLVILIRRRFPAVPISYV